MTGDLEQFASFYQLAAHFRRRLMEVEESPLTSEESRLLIVMLADYEELMTKSRAMMLRFQALGL